MTIFSILSFLSWQCAKVKPIKQKFDTISAALRGFSLLFCSCLFAVWVFKVPLTSGVSAPQHFDRLLDHFWAVHFDVAKLFWHRLTDFSLAQVGNQICHNLAVSSGLEVTKFLWLHHSGIDVFVVTFLRSYKSIIYSLISRTFYLTDQLTFHHGAVIRSTNLLGNLFTPGLLATFG